MVAGASGVDAALLVVAADDSVMPQTREHLALLELLGVRRGVIAITKCDLADEEQLELVDLEVAELVDRRSWPTRREFESRLKRDKASRKLRQALIDAARSSPTRPTDDPRFRLPIDRAFSPTGQGAVVTGTVWRGTARVGDTLHLLPEAAPVRIRRLQSQGVDVEQVSAGERAAINLVGIKSSAIHRGDELATPDAFEPSTRHLVQLRILPDAARGLKHRQPVRVHLGANQATAQVLMSQRDGRAGRVGVRRPAMRNADRRRVWPAVRAAATFAGPHDRRRHDHWPGASRDRSSESLPGRRGWSGQRRCARAAGSVYRSAPRSDIRRNRRIVDRLESIEMRVGRRRIGKARRGRANSGHAADVCYRRNDSSS